MWGHIWIEAVSGFPSYNHRDHASAPSSSFPTHSHYADKETRKDCLKPQGSQRDTGDDEAHRVSVVQIAEVMQPPLVHGNAQEHETEYKGGESSDQSSFEINNLVKPVQLSILR